jgi:hypothetical protein
MCPDHLNSADRALSSPPASPDADGPAELFQPLEFLRKGKSFWKTREAILRKLPVFDYSKSDLQKQGLMGPWKFNVTQSTIAALPGSTYAAVQLLLGKQKIFPRPSD